MGDPFSLFTRLVLFQIYSQSITWGLSCMASCDAFTPYSHNGSNSPTHLSYHRAQSKRCSAVSEHDESFVRNPHGNLSNIIGVTLMLAAAVQPVHAQEIDPFVYTNNYSDPYHPLCKRRIEVSKDGKTFHYSGTAVGPKDDPVLRGCSKKEIGEYKLRFGAFDGYILDDGRISAGDNVHEGVWEPAGSASTALGHENEDGIRWNDGNKWIVQKKPWSTTVGEIITFSYIGFSLLAGVRELAKRALAKSEN